MIINKEIMMERYRKCKAFIRSPFEEFTTKLIDKCNDCVIWYHLYNLDNVKTPMEECYF